MPPAISSPRTRGAASFTLVEMIVSMAILSILSLLLVTMLNQVAASWQQVQAQIDTRQTGRSILTLMASDLRSAALPKDRTDTNNLDFVVDPIGLPASSGYLYPHAFFWQAPIATDTTYGAMAEVGYFIRWDNSNASNPRAILCRFFVNPESRANSTNYLIYTQPDAWITSALLNQVAPGTYVSSTSTANYTGWVADNVLGLWVRCLDATGTPILSTAKSTSTQVNPANLYAFDSRQGYMSSVTVTGKAPHKANTAKSGYLDAGLNGTPVFQSWDTLPSYVDIAVAVVDARTASSITASSIPSSFYSTSTTPTPVNFWSDINNFYTNLPTSIQHGTRIYSTRVQLLNGG